MADNTDSTDAALDADSSGEFRKRWILIACAVVGSVMTMPYANALLGRPSSPGRYPIVLLVGIPLQVLLYYVLVRIGLAAARATPLDGPLIRGWNSDGMRDAAVRRAITIAAISGLTCGLVLLVFTHFAPEQTDPAGITMPGAIASLLASIGAGLSEEVLMRVFVMSAIAWVALKVGVNAKPAIWIAIVVAALLFGGAHLPLASHFMALDFTIVAFVIAANGIAGVVFGWLYWRYGIVTAMISHTFVDIVIKVIYPALTRNSA